MLCPCAILLFHLLAQVAWVSPHHDIANGVSVGQLRCLGPFVCLGLGIDLIGGMKLANMQSGNLAAAAGAERT